MRKPEQVGEMTVDDLAAALPGASRLPIMRRRTVRDWQENVEFYVLLDDEQLEALERYRREMAAPALVGPAVRGEGG